MKTTRRKKAPVRTEWPIAVYFWSAGLGMLSYVAARVILDGRPHPIHWLAGLAGGLAGFPIGLLWFRWRGNIF